MANEIRVTLTGDDELSDVVDKAAERAKGSLKGLGDTAASEAAKMGRDFDGGFDKLGEGAGGAEQKFIGLKDSITGTQDVMAGLKNGDVVTLAGGLADLAGAAEQLWASVGKLVVKIGEKIAAQAAEIASTVASTAATVAHTVASLAAEAAAKAWAAAQWLLNAAMSANPIALVVIAIVALVAAFVLAWQHSETFRNIVTGAFDAVLSIVQAVWNWISDNWPLLLAILTGPIGLAVLAIINHWDTIKAGVSAVKDWIVDRFNDVVGFMNGLRDRLLGAAGDVWGFIRDGVNGVVDDVRGTFDDLVNFIRGLPGRIADAAAGMFNGIPGAGAVRGALGHIPGFASGGIVTRPTLAVIGEKGPEAIVPLNGGGGARGGIGLGGGVTVVIQALDSRSAEEGVTRALEGAYRRGLLPRPQVA